MNAEGLGKLLQRVSVLRVSKADKAVSLLLRDYYTGKAKNLKQGNQLGDRIAMMQNLNASANFTILQS